MWFLLSAHKNMKSLPNILTILRIVAIPLIIAAFYIPSLKMAALVALGLFIFASITDFLDGYLARKYEVESKFGQMLDPIADKLLVAAVLLMLVVSDSADLIPVVIIILRELLVSGLREFVADNNGVMTVTKLAKWKTTAQFLAIITLIFVPLAQAEFAAEVFQVGTILLWIAAALTFVTGVEYTSAAMKFIKHLKEKENEK